MDAVVRLVADNERMVVAGVRKSHVDIFVRPEPATGVDTLVVAAVLHENSQGLGFGLTDEGTEGLGAAEVSKAANIADDAAELVGAIPRGDEGGTGARRRSGDGAVVGVVREIVVGGGGGQQSSMRKRA